MFEVLGFLGSVLGVSWGSPGLSWYALGTLLSSVRAFFELSCISLGLSWGSLGLSWASLGALLARRGAQEALEDPPGVIFVRCLMISGRYGDYILIYFYRICLDGSLFMLISFYRNCFGLIAIIAMAGGEGPWGESPREGDRQQRTAPPRRVSAKQFPLLLQIPCVLR